jgi:hypothetical protein
MRPDLLTMLGRVLAVVGVVLLVGVVGRLVLTVIQAVLPPQLAAGVGEGWSTLLGITSPALGATMALVIVAVVVWVIAGRRR